MMICPRISSSTRMKSFILLSTMTSNSWTTFGASKSFRMFASVRRDYISAKTTIGTSMALLPQNRYSLLLGFTDFMCLLIDLSA